MDQHRHGGAHGHLYGQPYLSDPTLAPGATWEIKLTQAGTYPYRCTIHPGMNGMLVVK